MTSLPFPSFTSRFLLTKHDATAATLTAVGTCRISPVDEKEYDAIVAKTRQQARVEIDPGDDDDHTKKLQQKRYMKEGVSMASRYLRETLQLDVSIVDVQVVMDVRDVVETDGCLCACLLDAGCDKVVLDGNHLQAMEAAKIPRDRLVASFAVENREGVNALAIRASLEFCSTISVTIRNDNSDTALEIVDAVLALVPESKDRVILELSHDASETSPDDLTSLVATISRRCRDGKGKIALIDPTARQLGMSYAACMTTDRPDGLYTTVVCTRGGEALGLVYSSGESIVAALECGRGVYYSRSRQGLWRKGDTSGHYQTLHRLDVDCDGDALRFTVTQRGDHGDTAAFCHLNTLTCWGPPCGLRHLESTLRERLTLAPEGSYTKRLFDDDVLLRDKLVEEAQELSEATEPDDVTGELADVLYFAMVRATKAGVSIDDAVAELDRRTRKVTRRKGDSKAFRIAAGNEILSKSSMP
jgi:phosphoribosyl-ATP pyrophosphohydrolase/phosphoribosyl-AMP cyclohydrolase/histidinol dehydrogenase